MAKSKGDFEVMSEMSKRNGDIACSTTIVSCDTVKTGCKVTMGIDKITGQKLMSSMATGNGEYVAILYVVNMEEFNKIKNE